MSEKFKNMSMVTHHEYIVIDKLIDVNDILEKVKDAIESRNLPEIQTVIEEVEFDKKIRSPCLVLRCLKKEMNALLVIFRVANFGKITVGTYYSCIRGVDSEWDAESVHTNIKEKMNKAPNKFEYYCAFELLLEIGWNTLKELLNSA
ncbi:MAG: hypothetical protein ACFFFH_20545 [Candidatus Thorarchaeota archaeon]